MTNNKRGCDNKIHFHSNTTTIKSKFESNSRHLDTDFNDKDTQEIIYSKKFVPKRLSVFTNLDTTKDRSTQYLYVDDNGLDKKIPLDAALNLKIRTLDISENLPSDLKTGDYIFREINKDE